MQAALAALRAAADLAPDRAEVQGCPVCDGLGAILVSSRELGGVEYRGYQRCDCQAVPEREGWLETAGVPPSFRDKDFATYRAQPGADLEAAQRVERWAQEGTGSLLLFGDFRLGKTGLACASARVRMLNGTRTQFLKSPDLLGEMRNSYDHASGGPRPSEILREVREVPLLVLDDLGVEQIPRDASWLDQLFYQVIDHRHDYQRPMIITTNLGSEGQFDGEPYEELVTRLHPRTVYRLAEMVGANVVRVGGANQRRRGR